MEQAWEAAHPSGYFLALYRAVTRQVRAGIEAGWYDDGDRMSRFDTAFANRYFEAADGWRRGTAITRVWALTFQAAQDPSACILQHLLLGINAHINLDLGVSAAEVAPGALLPSLGHDFERINDTLQSLLDVSQAAINHLSPMLRLLDTVALNADEKIAGFSIRMARHEAWENAALVAALTPGEPAHVRTVERLDRRAATLGRLVAQPGALAGAAVRVVRMWEVRDVRRVIETLGTLGTPPPR